MAASRAGPEPSIVFASVSAPASVRGRAEARLIAAPRVMRQVLTRTQRRRAQEPVRRSIDARANPPHRDVTTPRRLPITSVPMAGTLNARFHEKHPMPPRATETDRRSPGTSSIENTVAVGRSRRAYSRWRSRRKEPRCGWSGDDPLMTRYHDTEWGVPARDDRHLFEMLILEGAQAGLSWRTILWKRENYRRAFAGFDPKKVARFDASVKARLMGDPGIVRNRLKIDSTIVNARAVLAVQKEHGSLARVTSGPSSVTEPLVTRRKTFRDIPAKTAESDAMSKALAKLGFKFVGSTICYAFMQAAGLVDDHVATCFKAASRK